MVLSIISTKGGVGKKTLTANLAGYLSSIGKSVLMIDADPQPSLSSYYLIPDCKPCGLTEVLQNPEKTNKCISKTAFGDLIVSNDGKNQLQNYLLNEPDGRFRLKFAIDQLKKLFPSFYNAGGNIHERIDKATDDIGQNNSLKVYENEGNWQKISLIDNITYKNFNELIIVFNETCRAYFNANERFTRYLLNETYKLSSYQQIRVYELCVQYINVGHRKITIQTLKEFVGINKKQTKFRFNSRA